MIEIRQLSAAEVTDRLGELADVLLDCVAGGASVNFMAALSKAEAESFFNKVADSVARNERMLLAAFVDSKLAGTVQIVPATAPNQPHRADIAKLLVARWARSQGVGALLMQAVEGFSREMGKSLLVLDTVTGDTAERLYLRLGWTPVGVIPRYALYPDGRWCDTTFFYKRLDSL